MFLYAWKIAVISRGIALPYQVTGRCISLTATSRFSLHFFTCHSRKNDRNSFDLVPQILVTGLFFEIIWNWYIYETWKMLNPMRTSNFPFKNSRVPDGSIPFSSQWFHWVTRLPNGYRGYPNWVTPCPEVAVLGQGCCAPVSGAAPSGSVRLLAPVP